MTRRAKVAEILRFLHKAYGRPRPFRKTDPVDEIVRTILSQNTNDKNSLAAYAILKRHFGTWGKALHTDTVVIARLIRHAGLANIKARRIKEVLAEIFRRQGRISLAVLDRLDALAALEYLRSIKGIGPKTAACVLLFSFGKAVMPVDTHIFRVAKRLDLIDSRSNIEEAHEALTALITSGPGRGPKTTALIYDLHLGIIEHGRRTCRAQNPRCGLCALFNICAFKDKAIYRKRDKVDTKSYG